MPAIRENVSTQFFGHIISADGIKPDNSKVESIAKMHSPTNVEELRQINYVGKFLPGLSTTLYPVTNLLKKESAWVWDEPQEQAFNKAKAMLLTTPALCTMQAGRPWSAQTPAAMAWTLHCCRTTKVSCSLSLSVPEPLVPLINTYDLDKAPLRCQRLLMPFNVTSEHVPGKQLVVADALSRHPVDGDGQSDTEGQVKAYVNAIVANKPIKTPKLEEICKATQSDAEFQKVIAFIRRVASKNEFSPL